MRITRWFRRICPAAIRTRTRLHVADDYIIGAGGMSGSNPTLARGGELIDETVT